MFNLNYLLQWCQMKINRSETHDRLLQFKSQGDYISQGCQDCINNRPIQFEMPFYIFAHSRTIEMDERVSIYQHDMISSHIDPTYVRKYKAFEEVPSARLIWSPRLSKPTPQPNSMLFKAMIPTDNIKIIWMIPARELWDQYEKGLLLQNQSVVESINQFKSDFAVMSLPEKDDLEEERVKEIYDDISRTYGNKKWEMI